jgi:uncharacterized membrane protein YjgN (DUF898 family)
MLPARPLARAPSEALSTPSFHVIADEGDIVMNELVSPPPLSAATAEPVVFSGERRDFRRLVFRGALLELVTLGFYRFWLATDMRRHLWSHTSAGGDHLEYTGTGKELLIGFLVALAVLVPIYLVYFLIGLQAEQMQAFASIPLIIFFYLFAQFAIYRARRYRLTRTIWRGVRFWMDGSGWSYAWRAALWGLFGMFTLGLALPWRAAALERFKMRHSHFGDLQGRFDGTGSQLFGRIWWLWAIGFFAVATPVLTGLADPALGGIIGGIIVFVVMIGFLFIYPIYKAIEWRWWASGIRFGDVRFESKLSAGGLLGLYLKVVGWSVLLLLILSAWFGAVFGSAFVGGGASMSSPEEMIAAMQNVPLLVTAAVGYILVALALTAIIRIYLMRDLWARIATSTTVYNLSAADNVIAKGQAAGALGEGLADSLDVGGF